MKTKIQLLTSLFFSFFSFATNSAEIIPQQFSNIEDVQQYISTELFIADPVLAPEANANCSNDDDQAQEKINNVIVFDVHGVLCEEMYPREVGNHARETTTPKGNMPEFVRNLHEAGHVVIASSAGSIQRNVIQDLLDLKILDCFVSYSDYEKHVNGNLIEPQTNNYYFDRGLKGSYYQYSQSSEQIIAVKESYQSNFFKQKLLSAIIYAGQKVSPENKIKNLFFIDDSQVNVKMAMNAAQKFTWFGKHVEKIHIIQLTTPASL